MSAKQIRNVEKTDKPWGHELLWAHTNDYVAKILFIRAGECLSLQYHRVKEETLFLESGECLLEAGDDETSLHPVEKFKQGTAFHVPPGCLHRLSARTDCRIFEVSTPHLSDVVRLKDQYGRS